MSFLYLSFASSSPAIYPSLRWLAIPLGLGRDDSQKPAFYAGDGSPDQKQTFCAVDFNYFEMANARIFVAHLPWHGQSSEDATRRGAGANRAHRSVKLGAVAH